MKILKTALILVLIGIILYLVIAFLTPPITKEVDVKLNKSPSEIFTVLSNQSQMSKWLPWLKSVEQINGESNSIGTTSKFIFETEGYEIPILVQIDDYIENELIEFTITQDKLKMNLSAILNPQNDSTELDITYVISGNSFMTKAAMPIIKPLLKEYISIDSEELKELIEGI